MKKFLFYWEEVKSTFWFVPSLLIVLSIFLAVALLWLDTHYDFVFAGLLQYIVGSSVDSARSVLSTISGAMISVAGTTFSITLVALTLTSNQFGSRLIKNFMYVRINQVVLGAYVATYLYCLLVINMINHRKGEIFVPSLSIFFALLLAIVNIFLLIVFIHHIANSIQANRVIAEVTEALSKNAKTLFPEKIGEAISEEEKDWKVNEVKANYAYQFNLCSQEIGYLQYLDNEALLKAIKKYDGLLELDIRPGKYVVKGLKIGTLFLKETMEEGERATFLNHLIFGSSRLPQQDIEFSLNQLVEIAVRALSPGINDPFTANMCIDNLAATVSNLAGVKYPSSFRADQEGQLRLIIPPTNFAGILEVAFSTIRQYASDNPPVLFRLIQAFRMIDPFIRFEQDRIALRREVKMVLATGERHIEEEKDLHVLEELAAPLL